MSVSPLVGTKQAAKANGISPASLYRLAKAGMVPSYAAGPKLVGIRFDIQEVREALRRPTHIPETTGAAIGG